VSGLGFVAAHDPLSMACQNTDGGPLVRLKHHVLAIVGPD
jgi:hypothetical protein